LTHRLRFVGDEEANSMVKEPMRAPRVRLMSQEPG